MADDIIRLGAELVAVNEKLSAAGSPTPALVAERDRLIAEYERVFPPMTEVEIAEARANAGEWDRLIAGLGRTGAADAA